jgi:hypothetical protein
MNLFEFLIACSFWEWLGLAVLVAIVSAMVSAPFDAYCKRKGEK